MIETLAAVLVTPFALATHPVAPMHQDQFEQSIQKEGSLPKIEQYDWETQNATSVADLENEVIRSASARGSSSSVLGGGMTIDDWNSD